MAKTVPEQYKVLVDSYIHRIGSTLKKLWPFIGELGVDNITLQINDFEITIKKRG